MTFLLLAVIALLLAGGYLMHTEHRRTEATHADDLDALNATWQSRYDTDTGALADDVAAAEGERNSALTVADNAVSLAERYKADLDWAQIVIAAQALEIDRHFPMPTVRGERAKVAERRAREDNVVELGRKREAR